MTNPDAVRVSSRHFFWHTLAWSRGDTPKLVFKDGAGKRPTYVLHSNRSTYAGEPIVDPARIECISPHEMRRLRSASVVQLLFLPRTHVKPLFVDVDPRNLLPIVTKVVVSQIFATNSGVIHVLLCPLSPRFDVCTRQARYLLVTNFTPSSILTKSIHGHCTYPCPVLSLKRSVISSQVYSPSSSSDNSASTAASASVNRCAGPCLRSAAALPVERCLFMMS